MLFKLSDIYNYGEAKNTNELHQGRLRFLQSLAKIFA